VYREFNVDPYQIAKELGVVCLEPTKDELQFDLDDLQSVTLFHQMSALLWNYGIQITIREITRSRNGNTHIYATTNVPLTPLLRVALQACCGSDRNREALSLVHILTKNRIPPSVLFERLTTVEESEYIRTRTSPQPRW
jgi:hypothetical protein